MINVSVKVPPGLSFAQQIVTEEITSAMKDSTVLVGSQAKVNAGFITGNLARSIHDEVVPLGGSVKGIISASASYAKYVEEGTGIYGPKKQPFVIEPKNKKALFWKGAGHPVKRVVHKGQRPKQFMRNAFISSKPLIEARFNQAIAAAVKVMKK